MPEGDRDFSNWLTNIETLVREMEVPVIVKEVGFGMSRETVKQLASVGVKTVDISGTGGTDFAKLRIIAGRNDRYPYMHGWGQSTVVSLAEAMSLPEEEPEIIASGGIKNPLDIVQVSLYGLSWLVCPIISCKWPAMATRGSEAALMNILDGRQTKRIMTMLGLRT